MDGEQARASDATVDPIVSRKAARRLYVVAAVAAVLALAIHVTGVFGWEVDSTALGLIALLLAIPLAEQLRKLSFGGFDAEFAEVRQEIGSLEKRVKDIGAQAAEEGVAPAAALAAAPAEAGRASEGVPPALLTRIVWVDDAHERNNRLEIAELRQRFDVLAVGSTGEGLAELEKAPRETAVISDAVRYEDGVKNDRAGAQLLEQVRADHPGVPTYVYCGPTSVQLQGEHLYALGARLVTTSFTEVARAISAEARARFEALAHAIVRDRADGVATDVHGVDYVARVGARTVGVETRDWRRTPPAHAIAKITAQLEAQLDAGALTDAIVVAPVDVFRDEHRQRAGRVELTSVDKLSEALPPR